MSTHDIPFSYEQEKHHKLSQICRYGLFSKGLKNEFETAVVNEPSEFEPLKFYCTLISVWNGVFKPMHSLKSYKQP